MIISSAFVGFKGVSGWVQNSSMTKHLGKYRFTKRLNIDFEIVVLGRNEEEAAYAASSIDTESWNEFDSSWEFTGVSQIRHLALVEPIEESEIVRPVIKIWERTQAQGI